MLKNSRFIPAALCLALAAPWSAAQVPVDPAPAAPAAPAAAKTPDGAVRSVMEATHVIFGKLGIGVIAARIGPYLDEKEVRQEGLHARLAFSVAKEPDAHQEITVVVGQTVMVAGYRVKVEAINPGEPGNAVLRLWAPPQAPKPAKKWSLNLFGKD